MRMRIENFSPAGFGMPINQNKLEPVHWWTPADTKACDGEAATMMFSGDRYSFPAQFHGKVFCLDCVNKVLAAAEILGMPSHIPEALEVRLR